jgi:hypothetical protein
MALSARMSEKKVRDVLHSLARKHHRIKVQSPAGRTYQITPLDIMGQNIERMGRTPVENATPSENSTPVENATPSENSTPVENATPSENSSGEPLAEKSLAPIENATPPLSKTPPKEDTTKKNPQEKPTRPPAPPAAAGGCDGDGEGEESDGENDPAIKLPGWATSSDEVSAWGALYKWSLSRSHPNSYDSLPPEDPNRLQRSILRKLLRHTLTSELILGDGRRVRTSKLVPLAVKSLMDDRHDYWTFKFAVDAVRRRIGQWGGA